MAPVAAAPGARLAGGFFTCSVVRAGGCSYPPVSSATGQCAAGAGPAAKLVKNGTLKTYSGFPHGMPTTHAATINADLLAFLQA